MAIADLPGTKRRTTPSYDSFPADLSATWAAIRPDWDELRRAAQSYAIQQETRVASVNQLTAALGADHPLTLQTKETLVNVEKALSRALVKQYQITAPIGVQEWAKTVAGIGKTNPHLLARLLGHLGHPRIAAPKFWATNQAIVEGEWGDRTNPKRMLVDGEPYLRTLAQLRRYCGHGDAQRRRAGMSQEEAFQLGNPHCKMLVHLLAESAVKSQVRRDGDARYATGPLGQLYLDTRAYYSERGHSGQCPGGPCVVNGRAVFVRCKVDGHYADAGDPYQGSHLYAIAVRHVGKQILAELFDAASEDLAA